MTEPRRESAKRWRIGRVLAIYCGTGIIVGCASGLVLRMAALPPALAAGFVSGALVALAPVLNWMVRSGKAPWLLKE